MIEPDYMLSMSRKYKTYTGCEKPYLYEIINNHLNSIDVDKRITYKDAKHGATLYIQSYKNFQQF